MLLHIAALVLLTVTVAFTNSWLPIVAILMLWSFTAWSTYLTQQFNLVRIEPEYSGIMLSLNQSTMQLSMAAGVNIGGIVVDQISLSQITWIGAAYVVIALLASFLLNGQMKEKPLHLTLINRQM